MNTKLQPAIRIFTAFSLNLNGSSKTYINKLFILGFFLLSSISIAQVELSQFGTEIMTSGTNVMTVNIPTPVDDSKSILIVTAAPVATSSGPASTNLLSQLNCTSGTCNSIRIQRYGTTGSIDIEWRIIEFANSSSITVTRGTVQHNAFTLNALPLPDTYTVPIGATLGNSFVLLSDYVHGVVTTWDDTIEGELDVNGDLVLRVGNAKTTLNQGEIAYQVVEYGNSIVKQGNFQLENDTDIHTIPVSGGIPNPNKSWLIYNYWNNTNVSNAVDKLLIQGSISGNNVVFDRNRITSSSFDVYGTYYLIEFTDDTEVQHGSMSMSSTELSNTTTLTNAVSPNCAIPVLGYHQRGGKAASNGSNFSPAWFIPKLINDGAEISLRRGETNGVAAEASWSVIEFEYRDNFDGDGVPDLCDCDDDNDGLTDDTEQNGDPTRDTDGDGHYDHVDSDADGDGIPDNVEAQLTIGYMAPAGSIDDYSGMYVLYGLGLNPVDTDRDGIYDYVDLDSDNDNLNDIVENGMSNSPSGTDTDSDGLDNAFEGGVVSDFDPNDEINSPESSILPDTDGDLYSGGDLDYRDLFNTNPPSSALLDFDGVDDYLATDAFIGGMNDITLMAWYKADAANAGTTTIVGEDRGAKLYLRSGSRPTFAITTQGNSMIFTPTGVVAMEEWHHIAGTYSSSTGILKLYVDGELVSTLDSGVTGVPIETSTLTEDAFAVGRTSRGGGTEYFDGAIDEVRVFDTVLTDDQIQRAVYQEIENNSGNVHGSVIDKDIVDISTNNKVLWNDLIAYYPMTDIVSNRTLDYSSNSRHLFLYNITSVQEQTAPMPYVADTDGAWTTQNTWEHGDVWDIENTASNKDWSIVQINAKVTTSNSHTQLGMIIEDNNSLTVNGDNEINNSWYLELNGTLDLSGDSQLVQGQNSDLVTSANGKILRRQSGASNVFWYTYMSSAVGATAATTLIDNNTAANNPNNTAFTINTLKEGNGSPVEFTSAYNEVGKLSTRWMYTFLNGITYYDWAHYGPTTALNPGVGYIHKGTGNAGATQEYLFEGKPNNGTVLIAADDVDGDSGNESQVDVTQTTTLIGNPYPSAIDAHKFIDDNISVLDGTLYLWQQWGGSSHNMGEYEGGYAVLNKMSKIRAYQFVGYSGADNGSQNGTLTPTQYIAPGQSFMTEVVEDGNIEFNNAQRIFKKESNGETEFFRAMETNQAEETEEMTKIILNFITSDNRSRELVIGFGDQTTEAYDRGYDAKMFDLKSDDIYMKLNSDKLVANAQPALNANMEIPVGLKATGNYKYTIKARKLINFPSNMNIYLRDNQEKIYHDLRDGAYQFKSQSGEFNNRFDIVFEATKGKTIETELKDNIKVYFNTTSDKLFVKGLNASAKQLMITNMAGQQLMRLSHVEQHKMDNGISLTNLSSGVYIVSLSTDNNTIIDKKIIID